MWNVNPDRDKSRGGFQNADLGKTQFDKNYGPEYGVDYARFSDAPDIGKDLKLQSLIEEKLSENDLFREVSVTVRNEFVILKGQVETDKDKIDAALFVKSIFGVKEVINQITV